MALAFVQGINSNNALAQAYSSNVTSGNLLVCGFLVQGSSATVSTLSIADTIGNTWLPVWSGVQTLHNANVFSYAQAWYCVSKSSGANTVTVTSNQSGTIGLYTVGVAELSGFIGNATLDQKGTNFNTGALTTIPTVSLTTTLPNAVIFGFWNSNGSSTPTFSGAISNLSSDSTGVNAEFIYALEASTGTYAISGTCSPASNSLQNAFAFSVGSTFSISGNAGVAGAIVSYSGAASGSVAADGSGNYTISGLSNGSFTITPAKTSYSFSPSSQNVTVNNSNVASVNFAATQGPFAFTLVSDSFTRANAGSLGANWTPTTGAFDVTTLGITSNAATPVAAGHATSFWNANTFAADQWSEVLGNATGVSSTVVVGVVVRATSNDNYYSFTLNLNSPTNGASINKALNGTFTNMVFGNWSTGTNPYLLRLEVVGTTLTAYLNGVQVLTTTDSAIAYGSPGIQGDNGSQNAVMTNWRGGDMVWTRKGTVIAVNAPTSSGQGNEEPSVIYDTNPVIISANPDGHVFKMWYDDGWSGPLSVNYAESADGITWSQYISNPVMTGPTNTGPVHGGVFKINGSYYAYETNGLAVSQFDQWTSSNGVTWTKAHAAVLLKGVSGWDSGGIFNPFVWVENGTWYMLYDGVLSSNYAMGLATSPDGITWTKSPSNPVLTNPGGSVSSADLHKYGNTYFIFTHWSKTSNLPSDVTLYSATSLTGPWTPSAMNPILERELSDEGANLSVGQLADCCAIEVSGTTYMFNDATSAQATGNIHINLRTTPHTLAQYLSAATGITIATTGGGLLLLGA